LYRALLALPRMLAKGEDPPGLRADLSNVRGFSALIEPGAPWQALTGERAGASDLQPNTAMA
jgi:hypothetical protein